MSKKEIKEYNGLVWFVFFVALIIIGFTLALNMITSSNFENKINNLTAQLSQVPHKVCVNETTAKDLWTNENITITNMNEDPMRIQLDLKPYQTAIIETKEVCKWEGLA